MQQDVDLFYSCGDHTYLALHPQRSHYHSVPTKTIHSTRFSTCENHMQEARNFSLAESRYSTSSTQFQTHRDHIKRTTLITECTQFHACDHITIPHYTKHIILRPQRPHKAHNSANNSALVEHITIPCSWRQHKAHNSAVAEAA